RLRVRGAGRHRPRVRSQVVSVVGHAADALTPPVDARLKVVRVDSAGRAGATIIGQGSTSRRRETWLRAPLRYLLRHSAPSAARLTRPKHSSRARGAATI